MEAAEAERREAAIKDIFVQLESQGYMNIEYYIELGIDMNKVRNQHQETPLIFVSRIGEFDMFRYLVGAVNGLNVDSIDSYEGNTALHMAAKKGYIEIAEILTQRGANPLIKNSKGRRPLDEAVLAGNEVFAELLETYVVHYERSAKQ